MSDAPDMRTKTDLELENLVSGNGASAPDARVEIALRQREHAETLVDKQIAAADRQLQAAESVKWATILATIAAGLSAIGTLIQAGMAIANCH